MATTQLMPPTQLTIYADGFISADNGMLYHVRQTRDGTQVVRMSDGALIELPAARYSLAHDRPASGVPGRRDFERDLLAVIETER